MFDLNNMNDAQRKAVTHTGGPLLVLAGPGSGKTFTITRRILYLIEHGVPPERILVITFTKEAALSMQRRFQETSKIPQPVNFGTFHSVFFQILRKSNVIKSAELLSDSEKKNLLIPILQKIIRRRTVICLMIISKKMQRLFCQRQAFIKIHWTQIRLPARHRPGCRISLSNCWKSISGR